MEAGGLPETGEELAGYVPLPGGTETVAPPGGGGREPGGTEETPVSVPGEELGLGGGGLAP